MSLLAWVIVFLMLERSVNSLSEKSSLCILECLGGFKHSCSQQNCRAVCRGNESDELLCPRKYMKSLLVNGKSIIYCKPKPTFLSFTVTGFQSTRVYLDLTTFSGQFQ